jgi:hypothetical protein
MFTTDVHLECIEACAELLKNCHGTDNRTLQGVIDGILEKRNIDTSKMTPNVYRGIIDKARLLDNDGVAPQDQVRVFLEKLEDMGIKDPLIQRNDDGVIIAISWSDTSVRIDKSLKFSLLSFDCTHGMIAGMKLSAITGITLDGAAEVLLFTVLIHETKSVFAKEIQYLIDMVDPSLATRKITCMTDEDYGRIGATREVIELILVLKKKCISNK